MRVSELYVYPLKSAAGIASDWLELDALGAHLDRRWMLVDETARFISQREIPRLALIRTSLDAARLTVSALGMPPLDIPPHAAAAARVPVTVWHDTVEAIAIGRGTDEWFSDVLHTRCRLVFFPDDAVRVAERTLNPLGRRIGFADGFPLLIIGAPSLADLNARLAVRDRPALPMNRFRPNVVIEGAAPYAEDEWKRIAIGGVHGVHLSVVKACERCAITTVDQAIGVRGKEPLATLATYRRGADGSVLLAQNAIPDGPGVLRVGDEVCVVE